jgi:hypothetical protein
MRTGRAATTLDRVRRRLDATILEEILSPVVQPLVPQPSPPATVAGDAPGLASGAISTFFVKRVKEREPGFTWRHWRQGTMTVAVDRRVILAQTARRGPTHDGAMWRPRVSAAQERVPLGLVLADAEVDRERHHQPIRQTLLAHRVIPATRGGAAGQMPGVRARMRQECPTDLSRRRALIERLISAVTRQRSARAPGRALQTPGLQALRRGIAYHIYRLWRLALPHVLRMSTEPHHLIFRMTLPVANTWRAQIVPGLSVCAWTLTGPSRLKLKAASTTIAP